MSSAGNSAQTLFVEAHQIFEKKKNLEKKNVSLKFELHQQTWLKTMTDATATHSGRRGT